MSAPWAKRGPPTRHPLHHIAVASAEAHPERGGGSCVQCGSRKTLGLYTWPSSGLSRIVGIEPTPTVDHYCAKCSLLVRHLDDVKPYSWEAIE